MLALCAQLFPQGEDVREETSHGVDEPHGFMGNWKMFRFPHNEDMGNLC